MDIFNQTPQTIGGVFTSDQTVLTISAGGNAGVGALVQNFQANYSRPIQELYELGSNQIYPVIGRSAGTMSIERIIGVGVPLSVVDSALFDACNGGGTMTISANASACASNGGSVLLTFGGLVVMSYGVTINVNDHMIREGLQLKFYSLSKTYG